MSSNRVFWQCHVALGFFHRGIAVAVLEQVLDDEVRVHLSAANSAVGCWPLDGVPLSVTWDAVVNPEISLLASPLGELPSDIP